MVKADGRVLSLVGTDDAHLNRDRYPAAGGADDARTGSAPVDLHLGVTHAPYRRVLDAMHADDVDLAIAGHTHGGQLALPFWGALVTNCDLDTGRAKGLHGWPGPRPDRPGGAGSTWMHVSAGLGTSPYAPVRFACRPEATLLTLVARLTTSGFVATASPGSAQQRHSVSSHRHSSAILTRLHGVWRSLVARFVRDEEVVGSNPATPTV